MIASAIMINGKSTHETQHSATSPKKSSILEKRDSDKSLRADIFFFIDKLIERW